MLRPTLKNIILFWILKYVGFFIFILVYFNVLGIFTPTFIGMDGSELVIVSLLISFGVYFYSIFIGVLLLCLPLYYAFHVRSRGLKFFLLFVILQLEFTYMSWLFSGEDFRFSAVNELISLIFILLLFYKDLTVKSADKEIT